MNFDLRPCHLDEVRELCEAHHGYASAGRVATYAFGVYERRWPANSYSHNDFIQGRLVAAYAWQPPPARRRRFRLP